MTSPASTDNHSDRLERGLCWILGSLSVVWLLGWLPQYLTWPWWIDLDTYAWLAQAWSAGTVPYRDVRVFNFPGQIYLFLGLGWGFGWGHTASIYALDCALLLSLIFLILSWSRNRLGSRLSGWFATVSLLAYYLNQPYHLVAQRDWQAALFAAAALLIIQRGHGRPGALLASAAVMAVAFTIRPHVVLLLPPIGLALWLEAPARSSVRPPHPIKPFLIWSIGFGASVFVAFLPLIVFGLIDDLINAIRTVSYGTRYAGLARPGLLQSLLLQNGLDPSLMSWRSTREILRTLDLGKLGLLFILNGVWLARTRNQPLRILAGPWVLALGIAFLYEPVHPIRHAYLAHPLRVFWTLNLAVFVAAIRSLPVQPQSARRWSLGLLALVMALLPGWPRFWSPARSTEAWKDLAKNELPARVPLGAQTYFAPGDTRSPYRWEEYRQTINYLRTKTSQSTLVANLLRNFPFPAINGPAGRISPLTAEGAVPYLYTINPEIEPEFAKALTNAPPGTVVVWDPEQPSFTPFLELPTIRQVMSQQYRQEQRFGVIEIWRKR